MVSIGFPLDIIFTTRTGFLMTNLSFLYIYQKFQEFSEFLADEYTCSYFSKERRWFKNNLVQLDDTYPFDRVVSFLRDIRKQGLTGDGHTFLDRFRTLLTEIGNALGFVRMIRCARMNFCSEGMMFIPDVHMNFEKRMSSVAAQSENETQNFASDTLKAAHNVDKVLSTLSQDGDDFNYVQILLKVFRKVLSEGSHDHFDNFYIMIPALSLSWMEASIRAKEMLHKKNRTRDAYFTDDGFAMGTAFVLSILKQNNLFNSLQWEISVQNKLHVEAKQITEKKIAQEEKSSAGNYNPVNMFSLADSAVDGYGDDSDEDRDLTTLKVTEKRVEKHQQEMEMLFFALSSSRVFFKDNM